MGAKIFAGTVNTGIWRRPLSEVITEVERETSRTPNNSYLYQNYPNPFNPTTRFSFSIPEKSDVRLIIFDTLGNEITTLISEELTAGTYTIEWSATVPSKRSLFLSVGSWPIQRNQENGSIKIVEEQRDSSS